MKNAAYSMSTQQTKEPSADQTVSYCRGFSVRKNRQWCCCLCTSSVLGAAKDSRCNSDTLGVIHTVRLLPNGKKRAPK